MLLHQRLKLIRLDLNLSQKEMAEGLDLTQGGYSDIERGKTKAIADNVLTKLEDKYNVDVNWLRREEGQMFKNLDKVHEVEHELSYSELWELVKSQQSTIKLLTEIAARKQE